MMNNKAVVCEPLKDGKMLKEHLDEGKFKKVCLIFWHGVGDLVMFLPLFKGLEEIYPEIEFTLGLAKGLTHEHIPMRVDCLQLTGEQVNETAEDLPFDLVAKITFPMNEGQDELTKSEYSCKKELGLDPVWGHGSISKGVNRLVGVHFQITCLPDSCNPDKETAEKIWNEILAAGYIPIETHFEHVFHNPVNKKFDFIDSTVRRCTPKVSSLLGLINQCAFFIGVVSGPFHCALSLLGPERVFLMEKDFKRHHFTKHKVAQCDLNNYNGEVSKWLKEL